MFGQYARQIRAGAFGCLVLAIGLWLIFEGVQQLRELSELETRGVATVGALEYVSALSSKRTPTAYSFTVRYLDRVQTCDVSSELFHQYVKNGKFSKNASIDLLYLPEYPEKIMPQQMLGVRFYSSGPIVKFIYALPEIAISGLIFWAISLSFRLPSKTSTEAKRTTDETNTGANGKAQVIDIRHKRSQL